MSENRKTSSRNSASAIAVIKNDVYTPLKEVMKIQQLKPSDIMEIARQVTQEIEILLDLGIQHGHISLNRIFVIETHPWVDIVYSSVFYILM